jgi:TRAP-type C4-dicarboxylate transport system permease small subunit
MRKKMVAFDNTLDTIITIVFVFMLLATIMQVVFRYVLQISVPWTEEAARFALIFVTFWGAATALRERDHIAINTFFDKIPLKPRLLLQLVFIVAMGIFLVNVFVGSFAMIKLTWHTPVGSIGWLKTGHVYLFLPSGIVLMMIYLRLWAVETILEFKTPEEMTTTNTTLQEARDSGAAQESESP